MTFRTDDLSQQRRTDADLEAEVLRRLRAERAARQALDREEAARDALAHQVRRDLHPSPRGGAGITSSRAAATFRMDRGRTSGHERAAPHPITSSAQALERVQRRGGR